MVIYADILLAVNGWADYWLLRGVCRLGDGKRGWRLAVGAAVGAVAGLTILLPPLPVWAQLAIKLLTAAAMVLCAFGYGGRGRFLRRLFWLFGLSAAFAGVCGALYFFAAPRGMYFLNGTVYFAVSPLMLVALTVVSYLVLLGAERLLRRRAPAGHSFDITAEREGKKAAFRCLYDSGNRLSEPFSGKPVLIAERDAVRALLPPPGKDWRYIPYRAVGEDGLLAAFAPTRVTVHTADGDRDLPPCYIAVCDRLGKENCQGLLSAALGNELTV